MFKWTKKFYIFMKWLQRIFLPAAMGLSVGIFAHFGYEEVSVSIATIGGLVIVFFGAITGGAEYEYDLNKNKEKGDA